MSTIHTSLSRTSRMSVLGVLRLLPGRLLRRAALTRSRRSLARLDDHLLRDIGLSRAEALAEAARRGWDAPSHWKG